MRIVIFTQAGAKFGRGHLSRCEALADAFVLFGASVRLCVNEDGVCYEDVASNIDGADIAVIDSYTATLKCYNLAKKKAAFCVWFDDFNRLNYKGAYVIKNKIILRKAFWDDAPRESKNKVFVSFGATDNTRNVQKICDELEKEFPDKKIVTPYGLNASETAKLMAECDFAVSAAGQTLQELCALGVPSVGVVIADNQIANASMLERDNHILAKLNVNETNWAQNALKALKSGKGVVKLNVQTKSVAFDILRVAKTPAFRRDLQIDGLDLKSFVNLGKKEALRVLSWRNSFGVRKWMLNSNEISEAEHFGFLKARASDEKSFYWLVLSDKRELGVVSVARIDWQNRVGYGGWYANPDSSAKGGGIIFDRLCIFIAFNLLGLRKIVMEVASSNKTPIAIHGLSGFASEGAIKNYFANGDDLMLLGLLNDSSH